MDGDNETADRAKILFEATQELIAAEYQYYVAQQAFEAAVQLRDQRNISRASRAVSAAVDRFARAKRQCANIAPENSQIDPDQDQAR